MIFSENRFPLFGIMLSAQILTYPHSALIGKANPDRTRAEQTET